MKRTERLELWASLRQAESECGDKVPVLAFRRNGDRWYAALPLDALIEMLPR